MIYESRFTQGYPQSSFRVRIKKRVARRLGLGDGRSSCLGWADGRQLLFRSITFNGSLPFCWLAFLLITSLWGASALHVSLACAAWPLISIGGRCGPFFGMRVQRFYIFTKPVFARLIGKKHLITLYPSAYGQGLSYTPNAEYPTFLVVSGGVLVPTTSLLCDSEYASPVCAGRLPYGWRKSCPPVESRPITPMEPPTRFHWN